MKIFTFPYLQLASAAPKLYRLDLSQICNKPFFETDAVLALQYFRQLKVLIMDGFVIQKTAGKGEIFSNFNFDILF